MGGERLLEHHSSCIAIVEFVPNSITFFCWIGLIFDSEFLSPLAGRNIKLVVDEFYHRRKSADPPIFRKKTEQETFQKNVAHPLPTSDSSLSPDPTHHVVGGSPNRLPAPPPHY